LVAILQSGLNLAEANNGPNPLYRLFIINIKYTKKRLYKQPFFTLRIFSFIEFQFSVQQFFVCSEW